VLLAKYNQNDQVKEGEIDKVCSTHGRKTNSYSVLEGKPEGKTPLGRPKCRWEDTVKIDLKEIGWGGMD
jgi:hypothetical protein